MHIVKSKNFWNCKAWTIFLLRTQKCHYFYHMISLSIDMASFRSIFWGHLVAIWESCSSIEPSRTWMGDRLKKKVRFPIFFSKNFFCSFYNFSSFVGFFRQFQSHTLFRWLQYMTFCHEIVSSKFQKTGKLNFLKKG